MCGCARAWLACLPSRSRRLQVRLEPDTRFFICNLPFFRYSPSIFIYYNKHIYIQTTQHPLSACPPTPETDELVVQAFQMMQSPHADAVKIHKQFLKVSADASTLTCHITQPTQVEKETSARVSNDKSPPPLPPPLHNRGLRVVPHLEHAHAHAHITFVTTQKKCH